MQTSTTVREFMELDTKEAYAVGRAYGRQYERVPQQESEVVRRVDYLVKKVMFAELTRRHWGQGYENLKLLVRRW